MDKFLAGIPKNILAVGAVALGIAFFLINDPPRTVCDSQIEAFKTAQADFLYKEKNFPKAKKLTTRRYQYMHDLCRDSNNPGGCYEYFSLVRNLLRDLEAFPEECSTTPRKISEVDFVLKKTMEMMVRIAWGEQPPTAYHAKFNWLDTADIALYCKIKSYFIRIYGNPSWDAFQNKLMLDLPGAKDLPRNQIWDMSLFSENCARYP
jgi:hypothetical protein